MSNNADIKEALLQGTEEITLLNAQSEFIELIKELEGNEGAQKAAEYLFTTGHKRLSSINEIEMNDIIWTLSQSFSELVDSFKLEIGLDPDGTEPDTESWGKNLTEKVGQMIRFVNLLIYLRNSEQDTIKDKLLIYLKDIKIEIFNNRPDWRFKREDWAEAFKKMEKYTHSPNLHRGKRMGFETYYAGGLSEIIRTITNKKRHGSGYPKEFKTNFNFYNDFFQLFGIYNISLYAFIELLEGWAYVKPFIDQQIRMIT